MALAKEVNMGLPDLLVSLALLDRTASLVLREKEEPPERKEKVEPLASQDPLVAQGLLVLLVLKVSRVSVAVLVALVPLAFLVHVVFLVLLAIMAIQGPQALVALQARTGPQVPQVTPVLLEVPAYLDQKVMLVNPERKGHLALKAPRELPALLDLRGSLDNGVSRDHQAYQVLGAVPVLRVSRVKVGSQEPAATTVNVDPLDPRVFLVWLVLRVNLGEMETLDQMVSPAEMDLLVARVIVEKMALLEPLVPQVIQVLLVLWVQLERAGTEEKRALLVPLVLLVLLVPEVLPVLKVHGVTKVKLVNVVLMASKDIEDSLATQDLPVLQVLLVTRVLLVAQALQAPGDLLDPAGLLVKTEQVDTLVPLGHQDLEATEEKEDLRVPQATQDNQVLLDPPVPLGLAVVEVLLLLGLEVVKNLLVVLHHIMETNPWISKSTLKRLCPHSNLLMDK